MILHEFPDLDWLKNQIARGFSNCRGWRNYPLDTTGFPSVIIHTTSRGSFRPDVKGPVSLFLNLRGTSCCKVDGHTRIVREDTYFMSNRSQPYTLQIEAPAPVETFNIHFGETFAESVLNALVTPADRILDQGSGGALSSFTFFNQLHRRDVLFDGLIDAIRISYEENGFDKMRFEQQLADLLVHLLQQHRHIVDTVRQLPPVRMTTRIELYRRLSRSLDHIHSCAIHSNSETEYGRGDPAETACSLDDLAATAFLSKYHFLRLFRLAYGLSPHQYIQQLRLERARHLLAHSSIAISDLSDSLGFANSQSFSRLFFQRMGVYPSRYRAMVK